MKHICVNLSYDKTLAMRIVCLIVLIICTNGNGGSSKNIILGYNLFCPCPEYYGQYLMLNEILESFN